MSEKRDVRGGGLVGPLILIGLGIVFLLNNLGVLSWSVWEVILRLWPILLIGAGLDILLGRRSIWGSLLALALTVAVLVGALWLSGTDVGRLPPGEEITQPLEGATEAQVIIDPGVGTLRVGALSDSDNLVEGTIRLGRWQALARDFTVADERATFTLRGEGGSFGPFVGGGERRAWELRLNPDVPLELEVSLGAGESDLDLRGLMVSDLQVDVGIGQTTVALPEEGRFQARIEGAIGQTIVVIPEGMTARVRLDTGLAASSVPDSYRCEDDVCTSPGYETADERVEIDVSQAIGNISIRQGGRE